METCVLKMQFVSIGISVEKVAHSCSMNYKMCEKLETVVSRARSSVNHFLVSERQNASQLLCILALL